VVYGLGSACGKVVALGIFAVKKTQRVLVKTRLTSVAKRINMALIIGYESRAIGRSALRTTDRIQM
jgi:hypothetical protein